MAFNSQKKILITHPIPEVGLSLLEKKGFQVTVSTLKRPLKYKEIIQKLKRDNYVGLISLLTDKIDASVIEAGLPQLKVIANYAVGYDNIDIPTAKKHGITICNAAGTSDISVAESALTLMLAIAHHTESADDFVRAGYYKGWNPNLFIGTRLYGKILGIVGTGAIGSRLAEMAHKGLGMEILYTDIVKNKKIEKSCKATKLTLKQLLQKSDVISLHVPLLPATRHLIGLEQFKTMKPSAFLINTARGAVIDEKALVVALKKKLITGAAIDVYEHEPQITPGLTHLDNIILTPHIASATTEAREDMAVVTAENIIQTLAGKKPKGFIA